MGEQWWRLGPMNIPSELDRLAMPTNFLTSGKIQMALASFEPGTTRSRVLHSAAAPHREHMATTWNGEQVVS